MFSLRLGSYVEKDIRETRVWYNNKLHGLGDDFQKDVYICLEKIENLPFLSPIRYDQVRVRRVHKKFPYFVHYEVLQEKEIILVLGVVHGRRGKQAWKERAKVAR